MFSELRQRLPSSASDASFHLCKIHSKIDNTWPPRFSAMNINFREQSVAGFYFKIQEIQLYS